MGVFERSVWAARQTRHGNGARCSAVDAYLIVDALFCGAMLFDMIDRAVLLGIEALRNRREMLLGTEGRYRQSEMVYINYKGKKEEKNLGKTS